MTYFLYIKHPEHPVYTRVYDNIYEAKKVYIALGLIPSGYKTLTEDGEVVRADVWPNDKATVSSELSGQLAAYDYALDCIQFSTSFGRVDSDDFRIFREALKSSVRNANDCHDSYSQGVADATGMIYRLISMRESLSEEQVKELRKDIQEMRWFTREARMREASA